MPAENCWLLGKLCCEVRGLCFGRGWPLGVYSCLQNCAAGKRKSWGWWRATAHTTYRDKLGKAPLRALSEMQLRSSVYRRVISILRNVPPLQPSDWSQHTPWNVLIIVLPSHWGAGSMGAGFARDSLQSVFPLSAFFLCGEGRAEGGGELI